MATKIPPLNITAPTTLARWYADREALEKLRAILHDPTFLKAVALLKNEAMPSGNRLKGEPQINNNAHAWLSGYCDAFNDLTKLVTIPATPNPTQLEEWTK